MSDYKAFMRAFFISILWIISLIIFIIDGRPQFMVRHSEIRIEEKSDRGLVWSGIDERTGKRETHYCGRMESTREGLYNEGWDSYELSELERGYVIEYLAFRAAAYYSLGFVVIISCIMTGYKFNGCHNSYQIENINLRRINNLATFLRFCEYPDKEVDELKNKVLNSSDLVFKVLSTRNMLKIGKDDNKK